MYFVFVSVGHAPCCGSVLFSLGLWYWIVLRKGWRQELPPRNFNFTAKKLTVPR